MLAGRTPASWKVQPFDIQQVTLPRNVPLSFPAHLVQQRPDILAAEAQLHSASAAIGVAVAQVRRPINVWSNLALLLAIYPVFVWVAAARSVAVLLVGMSVVSALASMSSGSFYASLAEALPQRIRSSGFGTVYASAIAFFGGTTQLVVTWLIHVTGSALAPAWYLTAATGVGEIALLLFPETAPARVSHAAERPAAAMQGDRDAMR